jgi:DNA-binding Lrp family transcriptional regulator
LLVVTAYILIQTEVGKAAQVAKDILEIKGVQQAEDVTGPYDVIVRAEARNLDELGKLVVARVQAVNGITRTSPVRWCASRAGRPPSGVRPTAEATATRADRSGRR